MNGVEAGASRVAAAEAHLPGFPGLAPDGAIGLETQALNAGWPRRVLKIPNQIFRVEPDRHTLALNLKWFLMIKRNHKPASIKSYQPMRLVNSYRALN